MPSTKIEGVKPHSYSVPEGLSTPKELDHKEPCLERCGGYVTVKDDWCPTCGWPVDWSNSKWRTRQGLRQRADEKAALRGDDTPAVQWLIQTAKARMEEEFGKQNAAQYRISVQPQEVKQIVAFVGKHGFQALQDVTGDCPKTDVGRGLIVHVVNKLQHYRPEKKAQETAKEEIPW